MASLNERNFSDCFCHLVQGLVHTRMLIGFRSKIVSMFDWVWYLLLNERGARTITGDPHLRIKEVRGINKVVLEEKCRSVSCLFDLTRKNSISSFPKPVT